MRGEREVQICSVVDTLIPIVGGDSEFSRGLAKNGVELIQIRLDR